MPKSLLLISCLLSFGCSLIAQSVTDVDGNVYPTITFGSQTWMRSNLEVKKFGIYMIHVTGSNWHWHDKLIVH